MRVSAGIHALRTGRRVKRDRGEGGRAAAEVVLGVDEVPSLWRPGEAWV